MNSPRLITAVTTCLLLANSLTLTGEDASAPDRFSDLLQVGETVLLRPSSTHPDYTLHLLSPAQADQVAAMKVQYVEMADRRDEAEAKLQTAHDLNARATLFVEYRSLASKADNMTATARLADVAYQIAHVGVDYVLLKRPEKQKYLPLSSIREMQRAATLDSAFSSRERSSRDRRSSDDSTRRTTQIRLKHVSAAQVAAVLSKFYPEDTRGMVVNDNTHLLLITANSQGTRRLKDLIETLDVPETNPPAATRRP